MLHAIQTLTTGEWCVKAATGDADFSMDVSVARIYNTTAEAESLARLFAAAPELLEACREALRCVEAYKVNPFVAGEVQLQDMLAAAIARADKVGS